MQTLRILFSGLLVFLVSVQFVLASPIVTQPDDQGYDRQDNIWQIRDVTVVDDITTPRITSTGGIRLVLPDALPIIWDRQYKIINLAGAAVTAGKVADTVTVTFENRAKVAVIPVLKDFTAGESVTITKLFLKGFYSETSVDQRIGLAVDNSNTVISSSNRVMYVRYNSKDDNNPPEPPENLTVSSTATVAILTWLDSVDRDVTFVEVWRAEGSGSKVKLTTIPAGTQTFTDTAVINGLNYKYALRVVDGRNNSNFTSDVGITIGVTPEPTTPTVCTLEYAPVCGSDSKTYSNACMAKAAGITTYTSGECPSTGSGQASQADLEAKATAAGVTTGEITTAIGKFSDLVTTHFASGFLARLTRDGVLAGYPDGTVGPDRTINRAELAKIVVKAFAISAPVCNYFAAPKPGEYCALTSFQDVVPGSWYEPFVAALKNNAASWTTGTEYVPTAGVTRGEAVWTILRAASVDFGTQATVAPFPDVSTSHPYAAAISFAKAKGIIGGYDNGNFGLTDTLTRAQVAKMIVLVKSLK